MKRITIKNAAYQLGMSPQAVRVQIDRGLLPIGKALPSVQGGGRKTYYVYQEYVDDFLANIR